MFKDDQPVGNKESVHITLGPQELRLVLPPSEVGGDVGEHGSLQAVRPPAADTAASGGTYFISRSPLISLPLGPKQKDLTDGWP